MQRKNLLLLLLLAMLWGPSFLFIKVAVAEIPPITFVFTRVALAAALLFLLLRQQKRRLPPPGRIWLYLAIVAFFQISLPFVLVGWAEQFIDSAVASILNSLTPIFTVILAHMLTTDDKITATKAIGILLGLLGSALLVAPVLLTGVQATTLGLLAMIVATACYGIALVVARKQLRGMPSMVAPTSQMLLATLFLIPLVFLFDQPFSQPLPSLKAAGSVVALAVFGTTVAFIVYYRLNETADASFVSLVTYLVPIFGIILGVLVLDERLGWNDYAGFALILTGVMIVNGLFNIGGNSLRAGQLRARFRARLIR
jgi:drug/metabolite transporter (DMT)-like permease